MRQSTDKQIEFLERHANNLRVSIDDNLKVIDNVHVALNVLAQTRKFEIQDQRRFATLTSCSANLILWNAHLITLLHQVVAHIHKMYDDQNASLLAISKALVEDAYELPNKDDPTEENVDG